MRRGIARTVSSGVNGLRVQLPIEKSVGVVGLEMLVQNPKALSVFGHFLLVPLHILQVLGEVRIRPLEDLSVDDRRHLGFHINVSLVCFGGASKRIVRSTLDSLHEGPNCLGVLRNERVVGFEGMHC
jgi:hypothetical protein